MIVYFHPDFYTVYTNDPAAEAGRMEVIMDRIAPHVDIVTPDPIADVDLMAVHPKKYIESIRRRGLYDIAALAAGAATRLQQPQCNHPVSPWSVRRATMRRQIAAGGFVFSITWRFP